MERRKVLAESPWMRLKHRSPVPQWKFLFQRATFEEHVPYLPLLGIGRKVSDDLFDGLENSAWVVPHDRDRFFRFFRGEV